jgi:S-adenosylmethionine hydrolase
MLLSGNVPILRGKFDNICYNGRMSIITLTTDFGNSDHYVAAMKGVILSINPRATIVDITHAIPPQDVRTGAFELANAAPYFPAGTIHVAVVDPGVGSERRPIAVRFPPRLGLPHEPGLAELEQFFVAPDNGVLTMALGGWTGSTGLGQMMLSQPPLGPSRARARTKVQAVNLTNRKYWRPDISQTFHGRDIFAPVAAYLSKGGLHSNIFASLGEPLTTPLVQLNIPAVTEHGNTVNGAILHIDRFGNCISNILEWRVADRRESARVAVKDRVIQGIQRTYAKCARGDLLALVGSSGYLEIAERDGNAARTLGAHVGDAVRVENS